MIKLEIRDFPKYVVDDERIRETVKRGIVNCIRLRAFTWTRDGTLQSYILSALNHCQDLEKLEINGHNENNYHPRMLLNFTHLRKLSLIMPSQMVVELLPAWAFATGKSLNSLTLVCKATTWITDELLVQIAPHLLALQSLYITGCPKVTHNGLLEVLRAIPTKVSSLGLEGVSPSFDMACFANRCNGMVALSNLRSITLTVSSKLSLDTWKHDVINLLNGSPLECFQLYSTGASFEAFITDDFWSDLVSSHGSRLTRVSAHRVTLSMDAIRDICSRCVCLEQFFIVVNPTALNELGNCLSLANKLRTIHLNFPLERYEPNAEDFTGGLHVEAALALVRSCGPTLTQVGFNSRVWQVQRIITTALDGEVIVNRQLARYDAPDIPEQFLVVRA